MTSKRHTIQVDFDDYLYDLARERRAGEIRARQLGFQAPELTGAATARGLAAWPGWRSPLAPGIRDPELAHRFAREIALAEGLLLTLTVAPGGYWSRGGRIGRPGRGLPRGLPRRLAGRRRRRTRPLRGRA